MIAATGLGAGGLRLEAAVKWLRKWQRPSLEECLRGLMAHKRRLQAAVILNALNPGRLLDAAAGIVENKDFIMCDDSVLDACLREIDKVAPLDMDMMSMRYEDSSPDELYPASLGFPMGWDEWEELVEDADAIDASMRLYAFVTMLRLGCGSQMYAASEAYRWGLSEAECAVSINPDWEVLFDLLDAAGLGVFKHAINACLYATDNPYFDYNPWDESEIYNLPSFTLEGVRALEQYWADAQPIREDLRVASEMFGKEPGLARRLYDLYEQSMDAGDRRPLTLAEVWANDEPGERVIDEFYGPLDGGDDGYDED